MPTLEGRIVGVEEKPSGWCRIETDTQPRFLDTKREDLIEEAYRLMDARSVEVIRYSEAESRNINERTGKPYTNRYYEGAATNGRGRDEPEPRRRRPEPEPEPERRQREPEPTQSYGYRTHPESAWRMALTSGSERAVQTLPLMPAEQRDFDTQKAIALAWARFITDTPPEAGGSQPTPTTSSGRGAYDEPLPDEDDIPF